MADVLVAPYSIVYPTNGRVRPGIFSGGTNSRKEEGIESEASLGADSKVELRFQIPPTLAASPAAALRLRRLAPATSGDAKVAPSWAAVAADANPDTATLNAEGTQTFTWAAGDSETYEESDVLLDAATFAQADAGKVLVMEITFETTNWTLAQLAHWWAFLKVTVS